MKRYCAVLVVLSGLASAVFGQTRRLTLDECVQSALEKNADVRMGELNMKIAGQDLRSSLSNFLPNVSGSLGYNHSEIGPSSALRIDPQTGIPVPEQPNAIRSWATSAGLSVNQDLFTGGYNWMTYRQNLNLKKSAEWNFKDTRQTIIYLVKERYYNLLKALKLLEVQDETFRSSEESFKKAEILYQVGRVPKSDVLKAKVLLETNRLAVIEQQNGLAIARASLNQVLGFDVDEDFDVVDNLDMPEITISTEDAMSNALTNHPALAKGKYDLIAAKAGVGQAVGLTMPTLSAYYGYSWRNAEFGKIDNILDQDYNWYAGIQLSVPIFQGFSKWANLSKARLTRRIYEETLQQTQRDVALEVKISYFAVQQSKKKIEVTRSAVEAAEEDLRLNKEKYSLGSGTMLDLINAQVSLTTAKSDHIQSQYDYKYAIARLEKAMGKLER